LYFAIQEMEWVVGHSKSQAYGIPRSAREARETKLTCREQPIMGNFLSWKVET
jgi:hypothetical protein